MRSDKYVEIMAVTFYGQSFDGIFCKFGYIPENVSRYYRENRNGNSIYKGKNVFNIYTIYPDVFH